MEIWHPALRPATERARRSLGLFLSVLLIIGLMPGGLFVAVADSQPHRSGLKTAEPTQMNAPADWEPETLGEPTLSAVSGEAIKSSELFADGFESWPGPWTSFSSGASSAHWGPTSYRYEEGVYSVYCAGSEINPPGPYDSDMESWMIAGPLDLSGVSSAYLEFELWLDSESGYDVLYAGASTDAASFSVMGWYGNSSGWADMKLDLGDLYGDGTVSFLGESSVWIAFLFQSDGSYQYEGAYIDDVEVSAETSSEDDSFPGVPIPDSPVEGYVSPSGDEYDVFSVALPSEDTIRVTAVTSYGDDLDLYLYPPGTTDFGDPYVESETGSEAPERLSYTVPPGQGGTYYLVVEAVEACDYSIAYTVADFDLPSSTADQCAVIFGISDYPGTGNDLQYTDDDARDMAAMLIDEGGYSAANVLVLEDTDVTYENMEWAVTEWLDACEDAMSEVVVYFSGHGTNVSDVVPLDEADLRDEALFIFDGLVLDDTFGTWLDVLESDEVAVIVDCCYSGGMLKSGIASSKGRSPEDGFAGPLLDGLAKDVDAPGREVMTACDDDETSSETSALENGVFTYYLLDALEKQAADTGGNGYVSCEEGYDYILPQSGTWGFTPQFYDGVAGDIDLTYVGSAPSNTAPTAVDDAYVVSQDEDLYISSPGVLANDSDPEHDPLTAEVLSGPDNGTLTLQTNGAFTYEPDSGWSGVDTFTYRANDGALYSSSATVRITVEPSGEAELELSVEELDFGDVAPGDHKDMSVTMKNVGTGPMLVEGVELEGWDEEEYEIVSGGEADQTLEPGQQQTIVARFAPTEAPSGPPTFSRYSNQMIARFHYDGGGLSAITVETYPQNDGGSGDCTIEVSAAGRNVTEQASVYGGDRYVLRTYIPLYYYGASFVYTSNLPGDFADYVPFDGFQCDGDPNPSLLRYPDAEVEVEWRTVGDSSTDDESIDLFGVGSASGAVIDGGDVVSLEGDDRYMTATAVSQSAFPDEAPCVVVATGQNWPDALGGAALAGAKGGPILLTKTTSLPSCTLDEIERLGASKAIILGGTGAVDSSVESVLRSKLGADNVTRIGGSDRYQTALLVAAATIDELKVWDGTAFCATGGNFPDALAAAPLSSKHGWPIYLTPTNSLGTLGTSMRDAGVTSVRILGGTGAISSGVESGLKGTFGGSAVERLAGDTRYSTAVEVACYACDECAMGWNGVALATGENFPDALTGGVLQGKTGSVMLLTRSSTLSPETGSILHEHCDEIEQIRFLGGEGAISQEVRDEAVSKAD